MCVFSSLVILHVYGGATVSVAYICGDADSRVVSHSTVVQEVPGSNPGDAEKCWAVMELFVNIYLYEFVLSLLCVRVRCFGLY